MKRLNEFVQEQLDDMSFDYQVQDAIGSIHFVSEAKGGAMKFLKSKKGKAALSAGIISAWALGKLAHGVYKLYLKKYYPKCASVINQQARSECLRKMKIMAYQKAIMQLKSVRTPKNREKVDKQILVIQKKIKKQKAKLLDLGLEF